MARTARRWLMAAGAAGALASSHAAAAAAADGTVRAGNARLQVISPTLIRLEYASDGRFEDRPTMTVPDRGFRAPRYTARTRGDSLEIRTSHLTLRYRRDSGPFNSGNLTVRLRVAGRQAIARPEFPPAPAPSQGPPSTRTNVAVTEARGYRAPTQGNLGGWYRALDVAGAPVALHDGLLSRDGWHLLDDSHTILLQDGAPGFAVRPDHGGGRYQDGYFFGYGHDYARGLGDLRTLTGAAPLLPRQAFGVWFSRYWAYRQDEYPPLLARFRAERIPLDVLPIDTDFKAPHNWQGWGWKASLFPDPEGFIAWAHREGIDVALNTHPSITIDDPKLAEAERRAGRTLPSDPTGIRCRTITLAAGAISTGTPDAVPECRVFDWARAGDQDAYLWLHESFEREGVDFWWLDYCCDESYALAPGLTQDTWINHLYAARSRARGSRWPVMSRIGASFFEPDADGPGVWAEHRNAIHFTGDTRPTWAMLDFQTTFTAAEGSVGIPYVSHDIGSFGAIQTDGPAGRHLPDDLYVRWVQSGTFQPILRLHSDHGERLPWEYPGRAQQIATRFLQLRGQLVPYLYTLARQAHDRGLPMARAMYLGWPEHDDAYRFDRQYTLGADLLVAPVGSPGDPATKEVWFPPGEWIDVFSGERHRGPAAKPLTVPLDRMPVFARAGAVVPLQEYRPEGSQAPPGRLLVDLYPGARRGSFTLYDDEGDGLAHARGHYARTRFTQRRDRRATVVTIGAARGTYAGRPRCRSYELRVLGARRPRRVVLNRRRRIPSRYEDGTATITTPCLRATRAARIVLR